MTINSFIIASFPSNHKNIQIAYILNLLLVPSQLMNKILLDMSHLDILIALKHLKN